MSLVMFLYTHPSRGSVHGLVFNMLDFDMPVSKFEFQSGCYGHFQADIFGKGMMALALNNPKRLISH